MNVMQTEFESREDLIAHVKSLAPWASGPASDIAGGRALAESRLSEIDPISYARSRNYGEGKISRLSPYIHHGILSLNEVRNHALKKCEKSFQALKFVQELAWRDYWQRVARNHPDWLWQDVEPYKTGFVASDYADKLPADIEQGATGVACLDSFIGDLLATGFLHNHARMYLASYVVHFRRIKWQAGARWFLTHLLDGDVASNNLSWQWVATTFGNKPYIFNLENVDKYFGNKVDTSPLNNGPLNASYETLNEALFPNLTGAK